jgi:hypothetical protein
MGAEGLMIQAAWLNQARARAKAKAKPPKPKPKPMGPRKPVF